MVLTKTNSETLPPVLLLCAGFGSRLRPLTDTIPKPLVELEGVSLLERHLRRLSSAGFRTVVINLHHLGQNIVDFVGDGSKWGLDVQYSWEPELLDTGGALVPLREQFSSTGVLIVNADSLFLDDPALTAFCEGHQRSKALASLLVRKDVDAAKYGSLLLARDGRVQRFLTVYQPGCSAENLEEGVIEVMYCGMMMLSGDIYEHLPPETVFSITKDVLVPAVGRGHLLRGVLFEGRWFDVGTPQRLESAREALLKAP